MNDLLGTVIEAHGGLGRWNQLDSVSARLVQGGAMWGIKGQQGVLDDVFVLGRRRRPVRHSHHDRVERRLRKRLNGRPRHIETSTKETRWQSPS